MPQEAPAFTRGSSHALTAFVICSRRSAGKLPAKAGIGSDPTGTISAFCIRAFSPIAAPGL